MNEHIIEWDGQEKPLSLELSEQDTRNSSWPGEFIHKKS